MLVKDWQVNGIWNTGQGPEAGYRFFSGTKDHLDQVLKKLTRRGRLVQLDGVVSIAKSITTQPERWVVVGIWTTPSGQSRYDERVFDGSKAHIEKVLARLTVKGRLVRLENYRRLQN